MLSLSKNQSHAESSIWSVLYLHCYWCYRTVSIIQLDFRTERTVPVRAVDSTGATIDFWLSAERDAAAAKQFFEKAWQAPGHPRPRVITVDGNRSYPKVIAELKQEWKLGRRCRCRTCRYLNNVVEQDHRPIQRRVNTSQGFRSFDGAWRTIQGYEVLHMIRKGQVRWLPKGDVLGQIQFIRQMLGLKAE